MTLTRRAALAAGLSAPFVSRAARANTVVRMGTLTLIHAITPIPTGGSRRKAWQSR